ncbi:hypothetical protein SeMB42_g06554 [Synchytrium endobioticum]|uniref:DNA helicase n=1 Tax=Synchytrium endobioticum TaxID=286115 RepID=A0A507CHH4_9FUNG|nr:hypothetical protein SeMB42_g06554 [Synchytrium endobioticum]
MGIPPCHTRRPCIEVDLDETYHSQKATPDNNPVFCPHQIGRLNSLAAPSAALQLASLYGQVAGSTPIRSPPSMLTATTLVSSGRRRAEDPLPPADKDGPEVDELEPTSPHMTEGRSYAMDMKAHYRFCLKCGPDYTPLSGEDADLDEDLGTLWSCNTCSASFHEQCCKTSRKGPKPQPPPDLTCPRCVKQISISSDSAAVCELCEQPEAPPDRQAAFDKVEMSPADSFLLFRCQRCLSTYHMACMLPLTKSDHPAKRLAKMKKAWKCIQCYNWDAVAETIYTYRYDKSVPLTSSASTVCTSKRGAGDLDIPHRQPDAASEVSNSERDLDRNDNGSGSKGCVESHTMQCREYFVKFEGYPWRYGQWVPEKWLRKVALKLLTSFHRRITQEEEATADRQQLLTNNHRKHPINDDVPVPHDWLFVDRVVDVTFRNGFTTAQALALQSTQLQDTLKYIQVMKVVWRGGSGAAAFTDWSTSANQWNDLKLSDPRFYKNLRSAYFDWIRRMKIPGEAQIYRLQQQSLPKVFRPLSKTPVFMDKVLKEYQIEGVNWLLYNWWNKRSSIIADDMGLGKTVQVLTFLGVLEQEYKKFPFLIVVPASTLGHWKRELESWVARLVVILYTGDEETRNLITQYEIFGGSSKNSHKNVACHVVLCSYEAIMRDATKFEKVQWEVLVADEGHRLKNEESKGFLMLNEIIQSNHRILMTGTPLQNNLKELYTLMTFLDPIKFPPGQREGTIWAKEYNELDANVVSELHESLKPYFLRRTKDIVLKDLPPKIEMFVPIGMSRAQRELYKSVLTKNYGNLRVVAHPYLLDPPADENELRDTDLAAAHKAHTEAAGKLVFLQKVLRRLKDEGHRVLIFSQFRMALDEIELFLMGEGYLYSRLDGTTQVASRQQLIDDFNDSQSAQFVFLLTTRAGGLGVNLTAADTVIIYDADWNPHADLQAMARSHRIGQTKPVFVYKLFTAGCVEERIAEVCKRKMVLDEVIVESMEKENLSKEQLSSIIKFGAEALFNESQNDSFIYDDAAIEKLLDRGFFLEELKSRKEDPTINNNNAFSFAKVWTLDPALPLSSDAPDGELIDSNPDPEFWDRVLTGKTESLSLTKATKIPETITSREGEASDSNTDIQSVHRVDNELGGVHRPKRNASKGVKSYKEYWVDGDAEADNIPEAVGPLSDKDDDFVGEIVDRQSPASSLGESASDDHTDGPPKRTRRRSKSRQSSASLLGEPVLDGHTDGPPRKTRRCSKSRQSFASLLGESVLDDHTDGPPKKKQSSSKTDPAKKTGAKRGRPRKVPLPSPTMEESRSASAYSRQNYLEAQPICVANLIQDNTSVDGAVRSSQCIESFIPTALQYGPTGRQKASPTLPKVNTASCNLPTSTNSFSGSFQRTMQHPAFGQLQSFSAFWPRGSIKPQVYSPLGPPFFGMHVGPDAGISGVRNTGHGAVVNHALPFDIPLPNSDGMKPRSPPPVATQDVIDLTFSDED